MDPLEPFLAELRPLLRKQGARAAYLIGSRARGTADEHSDIDVVVVAPSDRPPVERFKDYLPAIAAASVGVDLLVYTPEEFERMLEEERPFLVHALDGAKVVYEGRVDEPLECWLPPSRRLRVHESPTRDGHAECQRWLRQAEHDLGFGRLALREGFFAQTCFIAQQAAEKALKAMAYAAGERTVLGHSVVELVDRLRERLPELGELRALAGILDQYYVATRYPNGLPGGVPFEAFNERQAREAIEAAERFLGAAMPRLGCDRS